MTNKLASILQNDAPLPVGKVPDWMLADAPSDIGGGLTGGGSRDRISVKGNRFRLVQAGVEVAKKDEPYLDVVIIAANEHVSRIFYKDKFDPDVKAAPDCFSADGASPTEGASNPQSSKCATCPQNVKGSAVTENNKKRKACSYSKRIVVTLVGDEDRTLYQMDLKSMSIYGDGVPPSHLYTLQGYAKLLAAKKLRSDILVTRISFDDESSVPKLYFTPQEFLKKAEYDEIKKLVDSPEIKDLIAVDVYTTAPDSGTGDAGFQNYSAPKAPVAPAKEELDLDDLATDETPTPKKVAAKKPLPKPVVEVVDDADDALLNELDNLLDS